MTDSSDPKARPNVKLYAGDAEFEAKIEKAFNALGAPEPEKTRFLFLSSSGDQLREETAKALEEAYVALGCAALE
jgi:hypothetical protein